MSTRKPKRTKAGDPVDEVLQQLRDIKGVVQARHVSTFEVVWHDAENEPHEIIMAVLDAGSADGTSRFVCRLTMENGKSFYSGGYPTMALAIKYAPWSSLDNYYQNPW